MVAGLAGLLALTGCTDDARGSGQAAGPGTTAGSPAPDQRSGSSTLDPPVVTVPSPSSGNLPSTGAASTTGTQPGGPPRAPVGTAPKAPRTSTVLVAAVDGVGKPAPGYRVVDTHATVVACSRYIGHFDHDFLYTCSPAAAGADVCYSAGRARQLLCLASPWDRTLRKYATDAEATQSEPAPERIFGLLLDNGDRCRIRNGGAASAPAGHPELVPYYFCSSGAAVWAKAGQDPVDHGRPLWTVLAGPIDGPLKTRAVSSAYVVTTAD